MSNCLKEWEFFWKTDRKWIDDYRYLDGIGWAMGPVESAAQMRGYSDFFLEMIEHPTKIHKLIEIVIESIILYLKAQEKINEKFKRVFIADHLVTKISPVHCREFYAPYIRMIFDEFHSAEIKVWHMEATTRNKPERGDDESVRALY